MVGPITGGPSGGGSSAPQLPAWTYTSGAIGAGLFTTDNASPGITTVINLKGGVLGDTSITPWLNMPVGTSIVFTDSNGVANQFVINSITASGIANADVTLGVTSQTAASSWNGKYSVSFAPAKQSATDVGLGNVPNVDATNATNLSSGTVPDARFPATLPAASGQNLTSLPAANLSGVVPIANGGAGATSGILKADGAGNVSSADSDVTNAINAAITALLNSPTAFASFLAAASITPVADGTVTPITSETTKSGITTALS